MKVRVKSITPENFARFGRVVNWPSQEPTAQAKEFKFWSDIANYQIDGETEIGICTVYQQAKMEITGVERHLKTPEILIPIDAPFILPVLRDDEADNQLEAFQVGIGQAVVIDTGVWHGACLPMGKKESSYFVIFRRNTPHEDVATRGIKRIEIQI